MLFWSNILVFVSQKNSQIKSVQSYNRSCKITILSSIAQRLKVSHFSWFYRASQRFNISLVPYEMGGGESIHIKSFNTFQSGRTFVRQAYPSPLTTCVYFNWERLVLDNVDFLWALTIWLYRSPFPWRVVAHWQNTEYSSHYNSVILQNACDRFYGVHSHRRRNAFKLRMLATYSRCRRSLNFGV